MPTPGGLDRRFLTSAGDLAGQPTAMEGANPERAALPEVVTAMIKNVVAEYEGKVSKTSSRLVRWR